MMSDNVLILPYMKVGSIQKSMCQRYYRTNEKKRREKKFVKFQKFLVLSTAIESVKPPTNFQMYGVPVNAL